MVSSLSLVRVVSVVVKMMWGCADPAMVSMVSHWGARGGVRGAVDALSFLSLVRGLGK